MCAYSQHLKVVSGKPDHFMNQVLLPVFESSGNLMVGYSSDFQFSSGSKLDRLYITILFLVKGFSLAILFF